MTAVDHPRFLEAAQFLRAALPSVAAWPAPRLLEWLAHWWRLGQVGLVLERQRIRAVGVARCVHSIEAAQADDYHNDEGELSRILWVDQLASDHPLGLYLLLAQARSRFGPRAMVSGQVLKRPGELRMLPWTRVEKLLHHHGLT